MDNLKELIPYVFTGLLSLVGWWNKTLRKDIDAVRDEFHQFQLKVAEDYVKYEHLESLRKEIVNHLVRIEDKLDKKQDKE